MKSPISAHGASLMVFLVLAGLLVFVTSSAYAAPHNSRYNLGYYSGSPLEGQNPEYILQTLARIRQALIAEEDLENSKRGLDLGLGRGFSGSQAAKHLMGLAAANFAGGPGRRRRSDDDA